MVYTTRPLSFEVLSTSQCGGRAKPKQSTNRSTISSAGTAFSTHGIAIISMSALRLPCNPKAQPQSMAACLKSFHIAA